MFCGECGTKNDKDSKFCEKCGSRLEQEVVKEEKKRKTTKKDSVKKTEVVFCANCGTKNNIDAAFCEKCGYNLKEENQKEETVKPKKETVKISKKTKLILALVVILALITIIPYKILKDVTSPKNIAKDYIEAIINKDSNKLYSFLDFDGDTTFVSKDIFKDIFNELYGELDIINYKLGDVDYSDGNLSAIVNFTYTTKNNANEQTGKVNLIRSKDKKYFIFDDWIISSFNSDSVILNDFTLKVPKGSTVKYANIEVEKKYLNSDESTNAMDVYNLPRVFKKETKIETTLTNGIVLTDNVSPSDYYNSYTVKFSEDSLTDKEQENIVTFVKDELTKLYENAIDSKSWEDIKSTFQNASSNMKSNYEKFVEDIKDNYSTLKSITFKTGSLYDIDLDDDLNLEVEVRINYDYTVEYTAYDKQIKTSNKSSYSYMTVMLGHNKDGYYLYDIDTLQTYFYR